MRRRSSGGRGSRKRGRRRPTAHHPAPPRATSPTAAERARGSREPPTPGAFTPSAGRPARGRRTLAQRPDRERFAGRDHNPPPSRFRERCRQRLSKIVRTHLEREAREAKRYGTSMSSRELMDMVIDGFARQSGIPALRVVQIRDGAPATRDELDRMRKGLRWSPAFMFGIPDWAITDEARRFYRRESPSHHEIAEFRDLYLDLALDRAAMPEPDDG